MSSQSCYPNKAPTVDALLDTLAHDIRRELVYYFEQCTDAETTTLEDLVDHIEQRVPGRSADCLTIELVHNHLPKLADRGWLEYDRQTDRIRYYGHDSARMLTQEVHELFCR